MKAPNKRLRELRLARGWTIEQAAKKAGISRQYMGMLETGDRIGSLHVWRKIAALYETTVDGLLFGPEGHETCRDEPSEVKSSA